MAIFIEDVPVKISVPSIYIINMVRSPLLNISAASDIFAAGIQGTVRTLRLLLTGCYSVHNKTPVDPLAPSISRCISYRVNPRYAIVSDSSGVNIPTGGQGRNVLIADDVAVGRFVVPFHSTSSCLRGGGFGYRSDDRDLSTTPEVLAF
ncbi:hypothetical protein [Klebsiella aerogenes]|uniref:hypothetical protein n=1 Tax=Klebsiella aerogenes TaxID=548 RepID=UPI0018669621|nr:hypothetical protein [Klebsiella aerogenes]